MIYKKNLNSEFRLRLTDEDMDFLRDLSDDRKVSVSEVVRSIISEYRRSCEIVMRLEKSVDFINTIGEEAVQHGDTKTNINH